MHPLCLYSGNCIMLVWQHGSALQPCKCPLCRRQITLLVPSETSVRQRDNHDVAEVLRKIETYNRMFSGHSCSIIQTALSLVYVLSPVDIIPEGTLLSYALYVLFVGLYLYKACFGNWHSLQWLFNAGILGIVGLLDDFLIVLIFFFHIAAIYRSVLHYRHGGSSQT
ncbi:hypothetical protein FEM48_Zijuj06G0175100 [Ziziphus jujuba var. spinosa]|uniref:RING-type E3 ubiquitin transferase n=1 Tax=Ziziphus jujuba var. spinosa TaxID=714518 RepID=A0A978VAM9_ZIZJJ|nr:hypothetical protein FEM48_Zijuj06G0175100 [Ziziphus jujuba var. spinosa]